MKHSKQFAVIGLGYFGEAVTRTLRDLGHEVLLIDNSELHVQQAIDQNLATEAVCLDATKMYALRELGLENFDAVVLAVGENVQDSILAALNLMELGVTNLVAKASNGAHGKILEKLNVHRVIYPEQEMGERVARSLLRSNILEGFELDPRYSVVEVKASQKIAGQNLRQLDLRVRFGIYVIAIKNGNHQLAIVPSPEIYIQENDLLLILGENIQIDKFVAVMEAR